MSRGPIVNLHYWQVDKVSLVLGVTLGLTAQAGVPT